jgi:lipoprotein NlpI
MPGINTALFAVFLASSLAVAAFAAEGADDLANYDDSLRQEIERCNALIKADPRNAQAYDQRGSARFKLGEIDGSIADFDAAIKLAPDSEPGHWRRGISYYYAGEWEAGKKQFEGYQTVDDNDVENAVWRYLCMARDQGPLAARDDILKIGDDRRVPMRQIYELFAGRAAPDDVLAAARDGRPSRDELNSRLFYAHLYLGLYHEANGDRWAALRHIEHAAEKHRIGHYMWDVARVHAKRLRAAERDAMGDSS